MDGVSIRGQVEGRSSNSGQSRVAKSGSILQCQMCTRESMQSLSY